MCEALWKNCVVKGCLNLTLGYTTGSHYVYACFLVLSSSVFIYLAFMPWKQKQNKQIQTKINNESYAGCAQLPGEGYELLNALVVAEGMCVSGASLKWFSRVQCCLQVVWWWYCNTLWYNCKLRARQFIIVALIASRYESFAFGFVALQVRHTLAFIACGCIAFFAAGFFFVRRLAGCTCGLKRVISAQRCGSATTPTTLLAGMKWSVHSLHLVFA